jgi:hypothetical protein
MLDDKVEGCLDSWRAARAIIVTSVLSRPRLECWSVLLLKRKALLSAQQSESLVCPGVAREREVGGMGGLHLLLSVEHA